MGYSAMMPQECPAIAKEERDEISIRDICGDYANGRRIGRQPIKTSFGCSQADQRMRKIFHSEKSECQTERGWGRWQLRVTRGINLQQFLRCFARGGRFRNWFPVLVSGFPGCVDHVEKKVGGLFFLSLFGINVRQP